MEALDAVRLSQMDRALMAAARVRVRTRTSDTEYYWQYLRYCVQAVVLVLVPVPVLVGSSRAPRQGTISPRDSGSGIGRA